MKKILFLFLFGTLGLTLLAQESTLTPFSIGFRAGINGSSLLIPQSSFSSISGKSYTSTQKMKIGAHAGFVANIQLKDKLYLQPGILYYWQRVGQEQQCRYSEIDETAGSTSSYSIGSINTYTTQHLRIPVMVNYHFSTKPNHFVIGGGIFLDGSLAGLIAYDASATVTTNSEEGTFTTNYFGNGDFDPYKKDKKELYYTVGNDDYVSSYDLYNGNLLKRFDVGAALEVGYQISKFHIGVGAQFGLLNMVNPDFFSDGFAQRNFNLQLTIGYNFQ